MKFQVLLGELSGEILVTPIGLEVYAVRLLATFMKRKKIMYSLLVKSYKEITDQPVISTTSLMREPMTFEEMQQILEQMLQVQRDSQNAQLASLTRFEKIENRIDSNAKAIEALTQDIRDDRRRANEQIARLYEQTVRVSAAQADFYEMQADFYRRIDGIEDRYAQMMERVTAVLERLENR